MPAPQTHHAPQAAPAAPPCGRFRFQAGFAPSGPGAGDSSPSPATPSVKNRRHARQSRCKRRQIHPRRWKRPRYLRSILCVSTARCPSRQRPRPTHACCTGTCRATLQTIAAEQSPRPGQAPGQANPSSQEDAKKSKSQTRCAAPSANEMHQSPCAHASSLHRDGACDDRAPAEPNGRGLPPALTRHTP